MPRSPSSGFACNSLLPVAPTHGSALLDRPHAADRGGSKPAQRRPASLTVGRAALFCRAAPTATRRHDLEPSLCHFSRRLASWSGLGPAFSFRCRSGGSVANQSSVSLMVSRTGRNVSPALMARALFHACAPALSPLG